MKEWSFKKPIEILLVEDNPSDARLTIESFKNSEIDNKLYVVENGELAIDFLEKRGDYTDVPRPDIILLDLNLPKKNGLEVLAEIKASVNLRRIPVAVLTTSENENDIQRSYDLGANCFITKPVDFNEFIRVAKTIQEFWLSLVKLPSE
ncbi:MAG: response regulator [Candidatus Neomarinimicrobiota bacterium]